MSFDPNVSNRLHRSGAIDFNVAFDMRYANRHKDLTCSSSRIGKRSYTTTADNDSYSVCEGEPLYQVCNKRAKFGGGCAMTRKPIQLLSSLNGVELADATQQAEIESLRAGQGRQGVDPADVCDKERDVYFRNVRPCGVSVTKWNFGAAGKQGDLFVATLGGANTVYVDEDVYAGDTLIVDVPRDQEQTFPECTEQNPYGFIEWQSKKGVPKTKRTLVVRSLPMAPHDMNADHAQFLRLKFYMRQQVLGQCTKGAKKGERCDLILGKNAIGI